MEKPAATPEEGLVCPPGSALCLLPEPLISACTQLLLVKALLGATVSLVTAMLPLQ